MIYLIESGDGYFLFDEEIKVMYQLLDEKTKDLEVLPFSSLEKFLKFHPYAELLGKYKTIEGTIRKVRSIKND